VPESGCLHHRSSNALADFVPCDGDRHVQGSAAAWVRGIALLLRGALVSLIDNATCSAGRGATITVRVRTEADRVLMEVEDNGPGIPEAEGEHVFERFVRATDGGTGCALGLASVREIIERRAGQASDVVSPK
jgi:signal transduction histidine kinase